jgi:HEAT repeat protein
MPRKPDVEALRKDKDLEGLMQALRYPGSPLTRAQAAQALGQLNNSLAVESLIRSTQLDPVNEVQAAARQALEDMFGNNARNVIQAYPIYADEEPWIVEKKVNDPVETLEIEEEEDEADEWDEGEDEDLNEEDQDEEETDDEDEAESGWTADDLGPLITILRSERNPHLRLRAARALGKLGATNMHAVEALATTALWGERPSVRAAALQALVKIYGDEDTDRLLDTFRAMQSGQAEAQANPEANQDAGEFEGEPEDDASGGWNSPAQALPQPIPYTQHEPVIRDEGGGRSLGQVVWIGIILLVIVGLIVIFTYFK